MKIKLNKLVEHFTNTFFCVQGVYHYKIEPDTVGWQKSAPFPGFIFPLRGKAQFHFDSTPYLADIGKVIHGGADMSLDKRVVGKTRWEYISVLYNIHAPEPEGICLPDSHFELTTGQSPRLTELLWRLWRAFNQPGAIPSFQTETLFRCVLEEVFVCACNQTKDDAQDLFKQASSYICDHYMDALTVRGLAEQNGVNENRLFYVFRKYAGMGPGDYLMTYRLNRAKELLITGDAPVCEIAKSVGYSDALYFSRIFRKRFGISPSGLREKFRNNPYGFQDDSIPI
ncbi:helix-turn-helix domain-containing protein [Brassicibacter mesophilus]|uniref:helix-turn-helix domain-containing protein n=1 Tax=Brassicibacter mesophilus TaxID=745119 RepID=UPI003D19D028